MLNKRHFTIRVRNENPDTAMNGNGSALRVNFNGAFYRRVPLVDRNGVILGFLIGHAIDISKGHLRRSEFEVDVNAAEDEAIATRIEEALYALGGSWLCVVEIAGFERVYVDPSASLGLVFDSNARVAGSSASAILRPDEYESRFDSSAYLALDVENMGWFPAGLTAHVGIERLLPNHFLDLREWRAVRHWPRSSDVFESADETEAYEHIADSVTRQVAALASEGPIAIALTAGNETRFLLACSRQLGADKTYVTVDSPDTRLDSWAAKKLTSQYDLQHHLLPLRRADTSEAEAWSRDAGHCVGGVNRVTFPSVGPLRSYKYFVGGLGGEVGRAFWYMRQGARAALSGHELVQRMGLRRIGIVVRAVDEWLSGAPDLRPDQLMDLAYIELRIGPWAFASAYTEYPTTQLHPISTRTTYSLLMSLPERTKRANGIEKAIGHVDPPLLDIPINSYGDIRDFVFVAQKAFKPHRIKSKLRRILS